MQEIPKPGQFPGAQPVVMVTRPPLGILCAAAYLALWGFSLAVLSIFTLVAAISEPNPLTFESSAIAFAGIPIMQALAVSLLAAGYGLATSRPWAAMMTQVAALAVIVLLVCVIILGAENIAHVLWNAVNIALFVWTAGYVRQPQARHYLAVSVNRL